MKNRIFIYMFLVLFALAGLCGCNQENSGSDAIASERTGQLYMDVHKNIEGLTAEAVAGAHKKDLEVQGKYSVDYKRYWFDEKSGTVFCLVQAPNPEAAAKVHKEAHGLVADEIVKVNEGL